MLEDIISRAAFQGFDGSFFTHGSRDDDHGFVRMSLASHRQRGEAIKLWKGIVGQYQIKIAALELSLKVFSGFDTCNRTGKAVVFKQAANELSIGGTIFKM
jgi:hypothetical protein